MNAGLLRRLETAEAAVERLIPPEPEIPDWFRWMSCEELREARDMCAAGGPDGNLPPAPTARLTEIEATAKRRMAEGLPPWEEIDRPGSPWSDVCWSRGSWDAYWSSYRANGCPLRAGVSRDAWIYDRVREIVLGTRVG